MVPQPSLGGQLDPVLLQLVDVVFGALHAVAFRSLVYPAGQAGGLQSLHVSVQDDFIQQ